MTGTTLDLHQSEQQSLFVLFVRGTILNLHQPEQQSLFVLFVTGTTLHLHQPEQRRRGQEGVAEEAGRKERTHHEDEENQEGSCEESLSQETQDTEEGHFGRSYWQGLSQALG